MRFAPIPLRFRSMILLLSVPIFATLILLRMVRGGRSDFDELRSHVVLYVVLANLLPIGLGAWVAAQETTPSDVRFLIVALIVGIVVVTIVYVLI